MKLRLYLSLCILALAGLSGDSYAALLLKPHGGTMVVPGNFFLLNSGGHILLNSGGALLCNSC